MSQRAVARIITVPSALAAIAALVAMAVIAALVAFAVIVVPPAAAETAAPAALLSPALEDKDRAIRIQAIHGVSKIGGHKSAEVPDHYFARPSIRRAVTPQRQPK